MTIGNKRTNPSPRPTMDAIKDGKVELLRVYDDRDKKPYTHLWVVYRA